MRTGNGPLGKSVLGIGAPLGAAVLWGLFAAPKATFPHQLTAVATEVAVFGGAALGLSAIGHPRLALVFAAVVVVNTVLVRL